YAVPFLHSEQQYLYLSPIELLFFRLMKYPFILLLIVWAFHSYGQVRTDDPLYLALKEKDSLLFSVGFNHCNMQRFENLVSPDFEFFHDQSGSVKSKAEFMTSIRDRLCRMNYKAERELIAGSVQVFPLYKDGVLYGAIQTGIHLFYKIETNGSREFTSSARFTHVWLLENSVWQLSRVLSFDHQSPN